SQARLLLPLALRGAVADAGLPRDCTYPNGTNYRRHHSFSCAFYLQHGREESAPATCCRAECAGNLRSACVIQLPWYLCALVTEDGRVDQRIPSGQIRRGTSSTRKTGCNRLPL